MWLPWEEATAPKGAAAHSLGTTAIWNYFRILGYWRLHCSRALKTDSLLFYAHILICTIQNQLLPVSWTNCGTSSSSTRICIFYKCCCHSLSALRVKLFCETLWNNTSQDKAIHQLFKTVYCVKYTLFPGKCNCLKRWRCFAIQLNQNLLEISSTQCSNSLWKFWRDRWQVYATLAEDLLAALTSQAYVERIFSCVWASNNRAKELHAEVNRKSFFN